MQQKTFNVQRSTFNFQSSITPMLHHSNLIAIASFAQGKGIARNRSRLANKSLRKFGATLAGPPRFSEIARGVDRPRKGGWPRFQAADSTNAPTTLRIPPKHRALPRPKMELARLPE